MSSRIETEKKYYCSNNRKLLEKIKMLNYKLVSDQNEIDEYFTDIKSEYIKKRTCLRIRKCEDNMEITFKGKSKDYSSSFTKLESNFNMDPKNYDSFIELFSMLGFYSYTIVNKQRYTYRIEDNNYIYSIMVDNIEDLGGFVEFEIISQNNIVDEEELKIRLNKFVSLFSSLDLEEAKLPYRDFVAIKKYNDLKHSNNIKGVHINLDSFLKKYEKDFYNYYKLVMKKEFNTSLKWNEFKNDIYNSMINPDIKHKFNTYFDNLSIQDGMFMVLFELLKQLKEKGLEIILSTNSNETFINNLVEKMSPNIIDNIIYLNDNRSIYNELSKNNINIKEYFNISKCSLKETNSLLLIIINNFVITN